MYQSMDWRCGAGIVVCSGAAEVGIRGGSALDDAGGRRTLDLIVELTDVAVEGFEVGGVEGLVVCGDHDLDVVELGA
jgi:hypothetical protein